MCLPTPMRKAEGGDADLSILINFFSYVAEVEATESIYILKSTVPVGTTEMLSSLHEDIKINDEEDGTFKIGTELNETIINKFLECKIHSIYISITNSINKGPYLLTTILNDKNNNNHCFRYCVSNNSSC